MATSHPLSDYNEMRDFAQSPEPVGAPGRSMQALSFVVQKHAARRMHYDLRLELDGTLKSWAVPRGPSLDPADKRMAVQVEDHPLSYAAFEGVIPPGHYGAGSVIVWDRGTWTPEGDAHAGYRSGKLKFELSGAKLHGRWALVRMRQREGERQPAWLLMKERDEHARDAAQFDVLTAQPDSVMAKRRVAPRTPAPRAEAKVALPPHLSPQLATLVDQAPPGDDWLYEIKFDGYRLLTRVDAAAVRCFTRNGNDWSARLPALVEAIRSLALAPCWIDGEVVALDAAGVPDFQALQNAFDTNSTQSLRYFVFDLPFHAGHDLRARPLTERRELLRGLVDAAPQQQEIRFSEAFDGDPKVLLASAHQAGLEGLIGKRRASPYRSRRSPDWIKLKAGLRQEFVVAGYTDPKGSRAGLGALLLGVHDAAGALRYAGKVGTGFDARTLAALKARLAPLHSARSPFGESLSTIGVTGAATHWVRPSLLAEVSFAQWTQGGRIRHAVFHGLRDDKPASLIRKETPHALPARRSAGSTASSRVTHPERVVDAASGVTKGELVDFYARVAALMLPHLKARPVALVRAPAGVAGPQFFQKHAEAASLPGVQLLDKALDPGHEALLAIASAKGLQSAAQMNVIEFHTWNMTTRSMPRPDRMLFDLDPGRGVAWPVVREAAQLLHSFLGELGLESFLKTSGGKGLHVVVPLAPRHGWATVRQFSQAIVLHVAAVLPQRFVAKSGPRNRVGKIFIDYLRNNWGATTAAAWSVRSRPGLGVSVPIDWGELESVDGGAHWTLRSIDARLAHGNDAWAAYASTRQGLARAMKALGFEPTEAT